MSDAVPLLAFPLMFLFIVVGIIALTYQSSQSMRVRLPRRVLLAVGAVYSVALVLWGTTWSTHSLSADLNLVLWLIITGAMFVQVTFPFYRFAPKAPSA